MRYLSIVLNKRKSIFGKIIILFIMMVALMLTPVIIQNITSFRQAQLYGEMLNNIINANQLNLDVVENIEPIVWNIVAGKENFTDSGIWEHITDIRSRMVQIRNNTDSIENRGRMEISIRALSIVENYQVRLKVQISEK